MRCTASIDFIFNQFAKLKKKWKPKGREQFFSSETSD